jgi:poly(A) polymerase|eukprot:SAG25_NODE_512_length_7283_cov_3.695573_3_plen_272_part_00
MPPKTAPKKYGITEPISLSEPTAVDHFLTGGLAEFTRPLHESAQSAENRKHVLTTLEGLLTEWSRSVTLRHGLTEPAASACRLLTFGSYFLDCHAPDDDIDTLCLGPPHASRGEFFEDFVELLRREPSVSELQPILESYVPHIKITCSGVQVDILYAQLGANAKGTVEGVDIRADSTLVGIDEKSVLSLNGCRVGMELLDLVPDRDVFREALRCIKCWSRRRGIYGNILGFPGGVAYAILVARVCQLYPRAQPSTILSRFFRWYSGWKFVP